MTKILNYIHMKYLVYAFLSLLFLLIISETKAQHYPSLGNKQFSLGGSTVEAYPNVMKTNDGNFVLTGLTGSVDGDVEGQHGTGFSYDIWMIKMNGYSGDTIWISRAFGGSGGEIIHDVIESSDGNYVVSVGTPSNDGDIRNQHGSSDIWILKIDEFTGDTIWTSRALGGSAGEGLTHIYESNDGNYIVFGTTQSNNGDVRGQHGAGATYDLWAVKIDNVTGDTLWTSKALGGSANEVIFEIIDDNSGNYIVATHTYSINGDVRNQHGTGTTGDLWLVKIDGNTGDTIWTSEALGGSENEFIIDLIRSSDGHIVMVSETNSNDGDIRNKHIGAVASADVWVVKINHITGDTIWTSRALGGSGVEGGIEGRYHIKESNDGNYIIAGGTRSIDGDVRNQHGTGTTNDFWMFKLNATTGDTIWTSRAVGGSEHEILHDVLESSDGNFIIAGATRSGDGDVRGQHGVAPDLDFWLVKFNQATGDTMLTSNAIGGVNNEFLNKIEPLCDGGYVLTGNTTTLTANGDVSQNSASCTIGFCVSLWMVKVDNLFRVEWDKIWSDGKTLQGNYTYHTDDGGYLLVATSQATVATGEKTVSGHGLTDIWTSKIYWLEASFVADTLCEGTPISFTDSSDGLGTIPNNTGMTWEWDFGDTNTIQDISFQFNPQYTYPVAGNYQVRQIVQKECQRDTFYREVLVIDLNFNVDLGKDTNLCLGDSILLDAGSGFVSYEWSNGMTNSSVNIDTTGLYWVNVYDSIGCIDRDTVLITYNLLINFIDDTTLCIGDSILLDAGNSFMSYEWSNGMTTNSINVDTGGLYWVIVYDSNNCVDRDSILVVTDTTIYLGEDTTVCEGSTIILTTELSNGNYLWSTGENSASIYINTVGNYWVTILNHYCNKDDSMLIIVETCDLYIPNAFSPNSDGFQETFKIISENFDYMQILIRNKYGEKIFENKSVYPQLIEWDGKNNGNIVSSGVYTYQLDFVTKTGKEKHLRGNVTVIK